MPPVYTWRGVDAGVALFTTRYFFLLAMCLQGWSLSPHSIRCWYFIVPGVPLLFFLWFVSQVRAQCVSGTHSMAVIYYPERDPLFKPTNKKYGSVRARISSRVIFCKLSARCDTLHGRNTSSEQETFTTYSDSIRAGLAIKMSS